LKTLTLPFEDVFEIASDGVPVVKRRLMIRGFPLMPGARCRAGFRFAGWDIAEHIDHPVVVVEHTDHLELLGFAVYDKDSRNERWVKGWLVVKDDDESCSFFGLYFTKEQAEEARQGAGARFHCRLRFQESRKQRRIMYSKMDQGNC